MNKGLRIPVRKLTERSGVSFLTGVAQSCGPDDGEVYWLDCHDCFHGCVGAGLWPRPSHGVPVLVRQVFLGATGFDMAL